MRYLLVAHPMPGGIVHLPEEWAKTRVDHVAHMNCCDAVRETCGQLLHGTNVTPTSLDTHLRIVTTSCLDQTAPLSSVQALGCTRAVREWLMRCKPQNGLIVGGAHQINAVLMGMCDELKDYSLSPGDSVFIKTTGPQHDLTFYQPRHKK